MLVTYIKVEAFDGVMFLVNGILKTAIRMFKMGKMIKFSSVFYISSDLFIFYYLWFPFQIFSNVYSLDIKNIRGRG